jgi:hypothetical protein
MHARRRHRAAKTILRNYINAMVGFTDLAEAIHIRAQASQSQPDLTTLIANVNRLVWESSPQEFFASLFYGEYQPQSRVLQYVNAGHNPPIVIRQGHDRSVLLPLSPEGAPVGALRYSRRGRVSEDSRQSHCRP